MYCNQCCSLGKKSVCPKKESSQHFTKYTVHTVHVLYVQYSTTALAHWLAHWHMIWHTIQYTAIMRVYVTIPMVIHICCKCYINCHETSLVIIILTGGLTDTNVSNAMCAKLDLMT